MQFPSPQRAVESDFVLHDTWAMLTNDEANQKLQEATVRYNLPLLAQGFARKLKSARFPLFFNTHASRVVAIENAVLAGELPKKALKIKSMSFPTISSDFGRLVSPLDFPNLAELNRLIRLGADRIVATGDKFLLTFDWMLITLNKFVAQHR